MDTNWFKHVKYDDKDRRYDNAGDFYSKVSYDTSTGNKASYDKKIGPLSGTSTLANAPIRVTEGNKQKAQFLMNYMSKEANTIKDAFNKVSASCLKEAKFYIAQDRMLVAKAVAYRPKQESTELVSQEEMDFFGDIAAWEVETELR